MKIPCVNLLVILQKCAYTHLSSQQKYLTHC